MFWATQAAWTWDIFEMMSLCGYRLSFTSMSSSIRANTLSIMSNVCRAECRAWQDQWKCSQEHHSAFLMPTRINTWSDIWLCYSPESVTLVSCWAAPHHQQTQKVQTLLWRNKCCQKASSEHFWWCYMLKSAIKKSFELGRVQKKPEKNEAKLPTK